MAEIDAWVVCQIVRRCWLGVRFEVPGRPDDRRPVIAGHSHRNHVTFQELAEVNASVEAGRHKIDAALVRGGDIKHDVRISRANRPSCGASTIAAASRDATTRTRPASRLRSSEICSSAPRISPSAGRRLAMSCAPASVGATLRVVRASRRTPTRSSNPRVAWLSADAETPSRFAARAHASFPGREDSARSKHWHGAQLPR